MLKKVLAKTRSEKTSGDLQQLHWKVDPSHQFPDLIKVIQNYNQQRSMESNKPIYDPVRMVMFNYLLKKVAGLEGDYIEVGTYRGLTASIIWRWMDPTAHLYCFDSFEGFSENDLQAETSGISKAAEQTKFTNTNLELVAQQIAGGQSPRLHLVKGYVPGTFQGFEMHRFRFAHIDLDLEQPIRASLEVLWPCLVEGGVMMIHDYYSKTYRGVETTVDEFFLALGLMAIPYGDRNGTAVIRKPIKARLK